MVCRQDVRCVSIATKAAASADDVDREAPVSVHTSAATTVISRQTACTYRREILQGYVEKHISAGVPKTKVPLDEETLAVKRQRLKAYEEAHPRY